MIRRQTLRIFALLSLALAACLGGVMFYVKYQVGHLRDELGAVGHHIIETTDALHVLDAEWSYLNQPDRLKKLNEQHGNLVPLEIMQLASVDDFLHRPERGAVETKTMLASASLGKKGKPGKGRGR